MIFMTSLSFNNCKMPPIRALLAILIVVGHFSYFGVDELAFLRVLAPVCVSLFLFISGYGLMVSYQKKGETYLQAFLKKRLLKIVLPAILVSLLHLLLCGNGGISFLDRVRLIFTQGTTLLPHYWFVWAILFEYLVFWCSFKWLPGTLPHYAVLLLTIAFAVVTAQAGFDRCWWVCSLAFPTGLFFAAHENDMAFARQFLGIALGELAARGRGHDDARSRRTIACANTRLDCLEPRAALHQHSWPAAIRLVVDLAPAALAEIAQVDDVHLARALLYGARHDGFREEALEHLRLYAYDIDLQHRLYYSKKEGRPERGGLASCPSTGRLQAESPYFLTSLRTALCEQ